MFSAELSFEVIHRETLKLDKVYIKLLRKQCKELESNKKKHQKERSIMQRQHCLVVDKLVAVHSKEVLATEKQVEKMIKKKRSFIFLFILSVLFKITNVKRLRRIHLREKWA